VKVFVTGGGGFVGRYLVAHLEACGDEVDAPDESVDILDPDALDDAIGRSNPDAVYHLAALSHVGESWTDPARVIRVNVEGTANVLAAARRHRAARVLVVGSAEEYGRVAAADLPIDETTELRPATPYGASKLAASYLALQAHLGAGLHTVRVRAFSHTGPGQPDRFLVPALARRIAVAEASETNDPEAVGEITVGALDPVRDISDVRDVVRAYRLLVEHGAAGEVYNVCSGTGVSVAEVAEHLLSRARRPLRLVPDPELIRPAEVPRLVGSPQRLRDTTGWRPTFTMRDTLDAVLEHERARLQSS
jgi:GDP-4-dehydro-6-deoxy-D-mannose reductase